VPQSDALARWAEPGAPILAITDLSKRYQETRALDAATLAFRAGTIHAILGENGSGKSTLVKLLSGVLAPTSGTIHADGRRIERFDPAVAASFGVATVFQEVLIAPDRSVTDNVLLGMDGVFTRRVPRSQRRALAARALAPIARTPVDPDAPAGKLPLAARQLVVLARALVRRPRILILDEVTAALDFADREAVFQTMEAFARDGGLILFISHRMDEVTRLADRVTVLRSGRLIETLDREAAVPDRLLRLMAPGAAVEIGHVH
jgi:ribose transport system ATP-binding protein